MPVYSLYYHRANRHLYRLMHEGCNYWQLDDYLCAISNEQCPTSIERAPTFVLIPQNQGTQRRRVLLHRCAGGNMAPTSQSVIGDYAISRRRTS